MKTKVTNPNWINPIVTILEITEIQMSNNNRIMERATHAQLDESTKGGSEWTKSSNQETCNSHLSCSAFPSRDPKQDAPVAGHLKYIHIYTRGRGREKTGQSPKVCMIKNLFSKYLNWYRPMQQHISATLSWEILTSLLMCTPIALTLLMVYLIIYHAIFPQWFNLS